MDRTSIQNQSSRDSRVRPQIALMWRGNVRDRQQPTNHPQRLLPLITALNEAGLDTATVVFFDGETTAVRDRLLQADGVLTWINPLQDGQDRTAVDALLRDVASAGVWVSAHPDTILKMGTKEVLYLTQELGWGSDTDLYETFDAFALRFPVKLSVAGTRVLKPMRGNDGQGVIKVELDPKAKGGVRVQAASEDSVETIPLGRFVERTRDAFAGGARLIDQAFQSSISAGMVRCYMSQDRVVGFSEQAPRNLNPTESSPQFGMNSVKAMHGAAAAKFGSLRSVMEQDWTPGLQRLCGIETEMLPALWDADFLYRSPPGSVREPSFALCEINVSSVLPFPDVAAPAIAATVRRAVAAR
jgi:hypothetical protein